MKSLFNALLLGSALACFAPLLVHAADAAPTPAKKVVKKKKSAPKAAAKAASSASTAAADPDEDNPVDVANSTATEMRCAMGDKLTVYENGADNQHIGMRWKTQLVRMKRVGTTTGANRFESHKHGLVWIGIPAKGMLLDSKKGQQLANDCKSAEQLARASEPQAPSLMEAKK